MNKFKKRSGVDYEGKKKNKNFYSGDDGFTQDYEKAVNWYQEAADQGLEAAKEAVKELERDRESGE